MSPSAAPHRHRAAPQALFVHGAGATGGQWAIWRRRFASEGIASLAPDRPPSPAGLEATGLDDHIAHVRASLLALRAAREGPLLLVGASLGALLALAAAADLRGDLALVLVNPLPPAPWAAGLPADVVEGGRRAWSTQGRFESTDRALPGRPFPERHAAFHAWRDESARLLVEARAGLVVPEPVVPVLVIAAEGDAVVPIEVASRFALGVGASLLRVPGGHLGPVMGQGAASAAGLALAWWRGIARTSVAAATDAG